MEDVHMKILNQAVIHKTLIKPKGDGVIIGQDENNIIVKFEKEETTFPFPLSFEKFLKFKDAKLQAEVEAYIAEYKELETKKKAEEREAKLRAMEEAKKAEEKKKSSNPKKASQIPLHTTVTLMKTILRSSAISATAAALRTVSDTRAFAWTSRSDTISLTARPLTNG